MLQHLAVVLFSIAMVVGGGTLAAEQSAVRIDASSSQATEASYKAMMKARSPADQQKLAIAVLVINMQGVKSASEVVNNPALQAPSINRIRDKVAGMTAEQIIQLAAKNPSVRVVYTSN